MTDKLRYNLDAEGYVTEFGYMENYKYETDNSCPLNAGNWMRWKLVEKVWTELTESEYEERLK